MIRASSRWRRGTSSGRESPGGGGRARGRGLVREGGGSDGADSRSVSVSDDGSALRGGSRIPGHRNASGESGGGVGNRCLRSRCPSPSPSPSPPKRRFPARQKRLISDRRGETEHSESAHPFVMTSPAFLLPPASPASVPLFPTATLFLVRSRIRFRSRLAVLLPSPTLPPPSAPVFPFLAIVL